MADSIKEKYIETISDYDNLLTELECAIDSLNCVWWYISEVDQAHPNMPKEQEIRHNAVWANIQYLERLSKDLRDIDTRLWAIDKQ